MVFVQHGLGRTAGIQGKPETRQYNSKYKPKHYCLNQPAQFRFCRHTQELFLEGVQQIQLRTEGRENGDLEALVS
jgi:hypothetical protein